MSTNVTPAQAKRELTRRALPKGAPARAKRPAGHIIALTGAELKALTGAPAPKAKPAKAAKVKPAPTAEQVARKAATLAAQAHAQAWAAAHPGEKGFMRVMLAERKRILSVGDLDKVRAEALRVVQGVPA